MGATQAEQVAEVIRRHLYTEANNYARLLSDVWEQENGLWGAIVALGPDGPLVRMEFGVTWSNVDKAI
jgi:hypothetical protein